MTRPNILVILTDQLREPPPYEPAELAAWRRRMTPGQERLRRDGVTFRHHSPMSCACAPSRASLLTGHYPSLHGVMQTDGLGKDAADPREMSWLAPDTVPTLGDWFRAGGYRTFYKGKWHVSHSHLPGEDGTGYLQSISGDGVPNAANIGAYRDADLLDEYGFSEWVGPEPHGLGRHNTGTVKDRFTADETIELLGRLDAGGEEAPWLTVCSLLNPHDIALFGLVALTQGLRYHPRQVPHVPQAPTRDEDLSTKPACHGSFIKAWPTILAPQPWIELHRKFYYQLQATLDEQVTRVLDALRASGAYENTIVVFTSDHGDMQGAHGGMHEKWHNAYEETTRVPLVISGPPLPQGAREVTAPTNHADLIPTLLGLAGIDHGSALAALREDHTEARPLVGRDLSAAVRSAEPALAPEPVLFMTDDEISEGAGRSPSAVQRAARKLRLYSEIRQPNHLETVIAEVERGGAQHLVKYTRYFDNQQWWTVPGVRDERIRGRHTVVVTEPEPDEYELYDLTTDPYEERNLAHPRYADASARELERTMRALLLEQLERKRLVPAGGERRPGYRPPAPVPA